MVNVNVKFDDIVGNYRQAVYVDKRPGKRLKVSRLRNVVKMTPQTWSFW